MCVAPVGSPAGPNQNGEDLKLRYLIAETTWETMSLAVALANNGTLLTRTDRPEDIPHYLECGAHDLIVLDSAALAAQVRLSALSVLARRTPICVLARKATSAQVAKWLDNGAAMVIDAATDPEEVVARLHAVARRARGISHGEIEYGPLRIRLKERRAQIGAATLSLSPKLYEILEYLALRPGTLVTRDALLSHIYGLEDEPAPRVFDVYMCNLRAHLGLAEGAVAIETVRGSGYRFAVSADAIPQRIAA